MDFDFNQYTFYALVDRFGPKVLRGHDTDNTIGATKLIYHIAVKGVQVGSGLGATVGPLYYWIKLRTSEVGTLQRYEFRKIIFNLTARFNARCVVFGTAATLVAGLGRMSTLNTTGINDRGYRLTYNRGQNTIDTLMWAGGFTGALFGKSFAGLTRFQGTAYGFSAGTLAYCSVVGYEMAKKRLR